MFRDPRQVKRPRLEFGRVAAQTTSILKVGSAPLPIPPPAIQIRPPNIERNQEERPKAVFWDEQGRLLDDMGNIINLKVTIIMIT